VTDRKNVALILAVALTIVLAGGLAYLVLVTSPSKSPPSGPFGSAVCPAASGNRSAGNWTTYHQDNLRAGTLPSTNITTVRPQWASPSALDGQIYAEPLVCGDSVFVATENDSVYAINATTGATLWRTHLGTPIAGSSLPCGDIDPSGITGTPVIDVVTTAGTVLARHRREPDHAGAVVRDEGHVTALEKKVLAARGHEQCMAPAQMGRRQTRSARQ